MKNNSICITDALDEYLSVCRSSGFAAKTIANTTDKTTKFLGWLKVTYPDVTMLADIKTLHIRAYLTFLHTPTTKRWGKDTHKGAALTPYSVWSYSTPVKSFLNWCVGEEYIEATPFNSKVKVLSPKDAKHSLKTLSEPDIKKLFAYLTKPDQRNTYLGCRNLAICAVLLDTGIRLGELLSMTLNTLDLANNRFTVSGKTGLRPVLLSPLGSKAIAEYYNTYRKSQGFTQHNQLWLTTDNFPLANTSVQTIFARLGKSLKIDVSPHRFRHNFVSTLANNGVSAFLVQQLAGHASVSTTQGYYHQNNDVLAQTQASTSPLTLLNQSGTITGVQRRRGRKQIQK